MELRLTDTAKKDIRFFVQSGQKSVLNKIELLLTEIKSHPFTGTGKPELLKHNLGGQWSRRITREHRLVYEVNEDYILVHSVRGHYD